MRCRSQHYSATCLIQALLIALFLSLPAYAAPLLPPPPPIAESWLRPDLSFTFVQIEDKDGSWHTALAVVNRGYVVAQHPTITGSEGIEESWTLPDVAPGDWVIVTSRLPITTWFWTIDPENRIAELDEMNNTIYW